jgi:hypothetical protein
MRRAARLAKIDGSPHRTRPGVHAAPRVSYDFDKAANFAHFKTFALKIGTSSRDRLVDQRITAAMELELTRKGMTRNDAHPDVFVITHLTFDANKDLTAYTTGSGPYGWRWGGSWATAEISMTNVYVGTLIVDVIDAKRNELVWRGIGTKQVDRHSSSDTKDRSAATAVTKILESYPPPSTKA